MIVLVMTLSCNSGCAQTSPATKPDSGTKLANPASVNCVNLGGSLLIEQRPEGGQFGVCVFDDNRQCEEWALLRGECPTGGVTISSHATSAARYCALTGGTYVAANDKEQGTCSFNTGKSCDATLYFAGRCNRN